MASLCISKDDGVDTIGIRVIYQQTDKHPEIIDWAIENDVPIIHLIRENSLKTIVSRLAVKKRGVSHSTAKVKPITLHLQPFVLKMRLLRLTRKIRQYRTKLKSLRYLEISYESFVADQETETHRLLDFLHIDHIVLLTANIVKLNPDSLGAIIENYTEIEWTLQGTEFEKFLDYINK